ncbi:unnamed protein product [Didymodactylos carnosus]|uniref:Coiled-coil domain-containing protein 13 n=1 Tax=Didymodactylos carnosus TaxID=1234261 RepID=A0A813QCH4_9BILA|nr:unnamed protein product [Didymodactylos carnosus]CAF0765733.1 unnamed protein product [Didymodactylos carnosus]CAF3537982.1 unnamed protein product [Didymodactylos carnosus]CAF3547090.1 unnamed protein product [Didymodactylos carnosus]
MSAEIVREQFSALQKQQERRLNLLNEKKTKKKTADASVSMNLENNIISSIIKQQNVAQENGNQEQIRELRDENGRLRKLLAEKDYEVNYLRRISEEERAAFTGGNVGGDAIATKVVELSKKNRELCAELEGERAKLKKLSIKCKELESVNNTKSQTERRPSITDENKSDKELKELKEKLKDIQARHTEAKSQLDILKQELKKTQKALEKEVGDSVNVQAILNGNANWRGRQQQIIALQEKLSDLKNRIAVNETSRIQHQFDDEWDATSLSTRYDETLNNTRHSLLDSRHRDDIRKLEKDRKEHEQQQKQELETLKIDLQTYKDKFEQSKTRNTVLNNDLKLHREQLKTALEKGKHDDELIEALLKQQQQMKTLVEQKQREDERKVERDQKDEQSAKIELMKSKNLIKQLQSVIDMKEIRIRELELELDENGIKYNRDDNNSIDTIEQMEQSVTITSRRVKSSTPVILGPIQKTTAPLSLPENTTTVVVNPVQLTSLKQQKQRDIVDQTVLSRLEKNGFTSRPNSSSLKTNETSSTENNNLSHKCKELQSLNSALDIERNGLVDLVKTLQKRLDESTTKFVELDSKLIEQRKQNILIEKEYERTKLDLANAKNRTGKSATTVKTNDNRLDIEEMETNLILKTEENDALKNALKSMLDAKEEDLRLYNETIESVKNIFLQGIKQYKPT